MSLKLNEEGYGSRTNSFHLEAFADLKKERKRDNSIVIA